MSAEWAGAFIAGFFTALGVVLVAAVVGAAVVAARGLGARPAKPPPARAARLLERLFDDEGGSSRDGVMGWLRVYRQPLATEPPPPMPAQQQQKPSTAASSKRASLLGGLLGPLRGGGGSSSSQAAPPPPSRCFAVLRNRSLFLYADDTLLECVGVVLLALHTVELWPRRDDDHAFAPSDPIRLAKISSPVDGDDEDHAPAAQREYYLYAPAARDKEAWYFALRAASATGRVEAVHNPHFAENYRALVAEVRAETAGDALPWLNAVVGRVFLSGHTQPLVHEYLHRKIGRKLDKIALPSFLSALRLSAIDTGHAAPVLSNPSLVAMDDAGEVVIEVDVVYYGGARVELATDVLLSLGGLASKFAPTTLVASPSSSSDAPKPSSTSAYSVPVTAPEPEAPSSSGSSSAAATGGDAFRGLRVPVVLGVTLASLRGRLRLTLPPPPSNRVWFSFVAAPELQICAEPLVYSKHLRLAVVLEFIERKVRDQIIESLVAPNAEDACFCPSATGDGGLFYPDDSPLATASAPQHTAAESRSPRPPSVRTIDLGSLPIPHLPSASNSALRRNATADSGDSARSAPAAVWSPGSKPLPRRPPASSSDDDGSPGSVPGTPELASASSPVGGGMPPPWPLGESQRQDSHPTGRLRHRGVPGAHSSASSLSSVASQPDAAGLPAASSDSTSRRNSASGGAATNGGGGGGGATARFFSLRDILSSSTSRRSGRNAVPEATR